MLENRTPYELLLKQAPIYQHMKVCGCLAFASNPTRTIDNSQTTAKRSTLCVSGYPPTHKGCKLLNLLPKQTFISRDVNFQEHIFLYNASATTKQLQLSASSSSSSSRCTDLEWRFRWSTYCWQWQRFCFFCRYKFDRLMQLKRWQLVTPQVLNTYINFNTNSNHLYSHTTCKKDYQSSQAATLDGRLTELYQKYKSILTYNTVIS